jgi:hypothetical protein
MSTELNIAPQPIFARLFANVISFVFHPLFIPVYVTLFAAFVHPLLFAGYSHSTKIKLLATVFVNFTFFPAIVVFLCWRLGFITSIKLKTQKERLIPLAATMVFYFWGWYVLRGLNEIPALYKQFLLGSFITIIAAWLTNIYFKVSLHGLAMGGLIAFMCILVFGYEGGSAHYLAIAFLIAGAVSASRLVLASHHSFEVYAALVIGIICQVLAAYM